MAVDINGTTGLTFNNGSTQNVGGIGIAQTWQDVVGSRAFNTTYTNSTGKPIMVYVVVVSAGGGYDPQPIVGGVNLGRFGGATNNAGYISASFIVPNGSTYSLAASSANLGSWSELR
jgi:hypothetical protein